MGLVLSLGKNIRIKVDIFVVLISTVFFTSLQGCSSYYSFGKNAQNKVFLRGPGSCAQLILFDDNGEGTAVRGRSTESEHEKFKKLNSIEFACQFKIKKTDMDKFNSLLSDIGKAKISGQPKNDARRIEIYLGNDKKIDTYNFTEDLVMELIFLLNDNTSYDINSFCEPIGVID